MRTGAAAFVIACLFGSVAPGQRVAEPTLDRVYYTHAETARDLQEIATAIRTIAQISQTSADAEKMALTLRGTAGQIKLAEWLIGELDVARNQPPFVEQSQDQALHEFLAPNDGDDVVRVFHLKHATTDRDLAEITTLMRTIVEIKWVSLCIAPGVVAARGTAGQMRTAGWLVEELDKPADWKPLTEPGRVSASSEYSLPDRADQVARVFYLRSTATPRDLQEIDVTMRAVAGIRRVYMFDTLRALVLRGTAAEMALAEWLITELDAATSQPPLAQPAQGPAPHEYWVSDPHGENEVRVFRLAHTATERDLQDVYLAIRAETGMRMLFVCNAPRAVAVRGTAAEIALADLLVKQWEQRHSPTEAH